MDIAGMLDELLEKARKDAALKDRFLATRSDEQPMEAFCKLCQELGYPISLMDMISLGEDFYAAMRRSTNGGGENSPMLAGEDDYYAMFFSELLS